jgi:hypothetical protein
MGADAELLPGAEVRETEREAGVVRLANERTGRFEIDFDSRRGAAVQVEEIMDLGQPALALGWNHDDARAVDINA